MKPEHKKYILENIDKKSIKRISGELGIKERQVRRFLEKQKEKKRVAQKKEAKPLPLKKKSIILSVLLIVVLGFCVYANSLGGEFVWDDAHLIKDNLYIKNLSYLPKIFTGNIGAGASVEYSSYRPLQMVTYMVDHSLWGLDVRGYHFTNILLHVLAALGIYWLINILFDDRRLSLFTGILFVVSPIHVAVVSYMSGRADSLALVFMTLCFVLYVKNLSAKRAGTYALMLLCYISALLSRENSLILPVLLLLYHYTFKKKLDPKVFLPLPGIAFVYVLLRLTALSTALPHASCSTTLFQRIPGFFVAITNYVRLMLLPLNLHFIEYGIRSFRFTSPQAISGILILSFLLIFAFRKRNTNRLAFFSICWFFIALLPLSNLYPIPMAYMAEHWLYVPSIGFFLLVAAGISRLYRTKTLRPLAIIFIVSIPVFYSGLTVKYNECWKGPMALYERTLKRVPDSVRTLCSLGSEYSDAGKKKEAIDLLEKAIEINPGYLDAYNVLGGVYLDIGRTEESIALFEKAITVDPDYARAHYNLGKAYVAMGKKEEAIGSWKKAIEADPNNADAHYNIGNAFSDMGKKKEAIEAYKKATGIDPGYVNAYFNLGNAYVAIGHNEEAIRSYKKVLEIDPRDAGAHNNLARVYYREKQYAAAIEHCDKAIELGFTVSPQLLEKLKPYRK